MLKSEYLVSELRGVAVMELDKHGAPTKRIGKVHHFVFHPRARRVVGFTVKRPDIALMAHRSDVFVAIDRFDIVNGRIVIQPGKDSMGKPACKRLGVNWDDCVMWQGILLMTEAGTRCGYVGDVRFATESGEVQTVFLDRGKTADLLLGFTELPANLIRGFKLGVGDKLNGEDEDGEDFLRGAIIVDDEVLTMESEGGLAEKAGAASAVAANKASQAVEAAKPVVAETAQKAGAVASAAASKASEAASVAASKAEVAVNDGAFKLGQQLGKTRGMFSSFKEEYRRALNGEEGGDK